MKKQVLTIIAVVLAACPILADAYKDAYNNAGKKEKDHKYEAAAADYLAAAKATTQPDDKARAYFRAGECFLTKKQYDKSMECFKKILTIKGAAAYRNGAAQLRIGQIIFKSHKPAEAITELEKVQTMKDASLTDKTDAMLHCAYSNEDLKKYDQAVKCYEAVLKEPKTNPYHLSRAALGIGNLKQKQKKYDEALSWYAKIQDIQKANPYHISESYLNMGRIFQTQKKYNDAIAAYKKCIAYDKGNPHHKSSAQLGIGNIYYTQEKYDDAIKEYGKVKNLKKVNPYHISEAEFRTGNCYYSLKQYNKAENYFKKVLAAKKVYSNQRKEAGQMLKDITRKQEK